MTGVYKISCLETGDSYIGSAYNISTRWARHKKDLFKGNHHSIFLQRAWIKYTSERFIFEVIEECEKDLVLEKEQLYLDLLHPTYNMTKSVKGSGGRIEKEESNIKRKEWAKRNNIHPPPITWEKKRKPVVMLDGSTKEKLREFKSLSEACRYIGRDHTFVSILTRAIKLNIKAYNYFWKWK